MGHQVILFVVFVFFGSCSESYRTLNADRFNDQIGHRTDIRTPEELMNLYYVYPEIEGTKKRVIQTKLLADQVFEITLVHEGIGDDSQSAQKMVMIARRVNNAWNVIEIKENWKCWEERGHTSWGTTPCN